MSKSKNLLSFLLATVLALSLFTFAPSAHAAGNPCDAGSGGYAVYAPGETVPPCPGSGQYVVQSWDGTSAINQSSCDLGPIQAVVTQWGGTVYFTPSHPDCVAPAQPNPEGEGHGGGEAPQVQSAPSAFGSCPDYAAGVYVSKTWGVRVRQAAGLKSPLVSKTSQLQSKTKVDAVGCVVVDDLVWLEVNTEQFGHGFVAAKFFKPAS